MENNLAMINSLERCSVSEMAVGYIRLLAQDGRDLSSAAKATGMQRGKLKELARKSGIAFPDYDPSAQPVLAIWEKRKAGWAMVIGGSEYGQCLLNDGTYTATAFGLTEERTKAPSAMAALARAIDARAADHVGGETLRVELLKGDGASEKIFP